MYFLLNFRLLPIIAISTVPSFQASTERCPTTCGETAANRPSGEKSFNLFRPLKDLEAKSYLHFLALQAIKLSLY